jgi:hypothetical protein
MSKPFVIAWIPISLLIIFMLADPTFAALKSDKDTIIVEDHSVIR